MSQTMIANAYQQKLEAEVVATADILPPSSPFPRAENAPRMDFMLNVWLHLIFPNVCKD